MIALRNVMRHTTKSIILGAKLKRENHFVGSITLAIRTDARREQLVFI